VSELRPNTGWRRRRSPASRGPARCRRPRDLACRPAAPRQRRDESGEAHHAFPAHERTPENEAREALVETGRPPLANVVRAAIRAAQTHALVGARNASTAAARTVNVIPPEQRIFRTIYATQPGHAVFSRERARTQRSNRVLAADEPTQKDQLSTAPRRAVPSALTGRPSAHMERGNGAKDRADSSMPQSAEVSDRRGEGFEGRALPTVARR